MTGWRIWVWRNHRVKNYTQSRVSDGPTGKRIVDLQCSLALLNAPQIGRSAASHTALSGLNNVTTMAKAETLDRLRLAQVAQSYGLDKVVRWKPRKVRSLV